MNLLTGGATWSSHQARTASGSVEITALRCLLNADCHRHHSHGKTILGVVCQHIIKSNTFTCMCHQYCLQQALSIQIDR